MTNPTADPTVGPTTLLFQAPPPVPQDDTDDEMDHLGEEPEPPTDNRDNRGGRSGDGSSGGPNQLRMLKGARAAATGMHISDAEIRAVLEDPQDVQPDPNQPKRTQLRRDGLVVTTGNDGMILRVSRRR
jgi:hypothetical protein